MDNSSTPMVLTEAELKQVLTIEDLQRAFKKLTDNRVTGPYVIFAKSIPPETVLEYNGEEIGVYDWTPTDHNKRAEAQMERIDQGDEYLPLDLWDVTYP